MIAIICAMSEERNAFLQLMENVKIEKGRSIKYHNEFLDNLYYVGKIADKDVVLTRCGVGTVYSSIATFLTIDKYHPELVINVGVAGSLNKDVHLNDIVMATDAAFWRFDVPGWERSFNSDHISFKADKDILKIAKKCLKNVKFGPIVTADEFIYKKSQTNVILKFFPETLCGEMEGAAIANACFGLDTKWAIIRSISDETLVKGHYKDFNFNLETACKKVAEITVKLIKNLK